MLVRTNSGCFVLKVFDYILQSQRKGNTLEAVSTEDVDVSFHQNQVRERRKKQGKFVSFLQLAASNANFLRRA